MAAAIEDPDSALHASCVTLRAAGARLLARAQAAGMARSDIDGTDLFALIATLAWLGDQPSLASRADHLFDVVASAIRRARGAAIPRRNAALGPAAEIVALGAANSAARSARSSPTPS